MNEEPDQPDMTTFRVRLQKTWEVDYPDEQIQQMIASEGLGNSEQAVEQVVSETEADKVQPAEKLLGLTVEVTEQ